MSTKTLFSITWKRLFVLASICAIVGVVWSQNVFAAPSIHWDQDAVKISIPQGQSRLVVLTFIAEDNIPATTVQVVPALQPYVTVTPEHIAALQKGQSVPVTFKVFAPLTAPLTTIDGTVQLRLGNGSPDRTIPRPLPVTVTVVTKAAGDLPPDPGEAGKATLAGIDSNNNGVRDDVEIYIATVEPNSAKHREALMSFARAVQKQILVTNNSEASDAARSADSALECLEYIGQLNGGRWKEIEALMVNTKARFTAHENFEKMMNGSVTEDSPVGQTKSQCTFDPDALPN